MARCSVWSTRLTPRGSYRSTVTVSGGAHRYPVVLIPVSTSEPDEVAVNADGSLDVHLGADEVAARLGAQPGEHLRLVPSSAADPLPEQRRSVRGIGIGKVAPEDVLRWEDFEETSQANAAALDRRLGNW